LRHTLFNYTLSFTHIVGLKINENANSVQKKDDMKTNIQTKKGSTVQGKIFKEKGAEKKK
jgi:hypothetical protein